MSLKIVFMGTPEFSVPALEALIKNKFEILSIYTQPPKKSKRGQKINVSPIQKYSEKNNLPVRNPENLNNDEEYNFIKSLSFLIYNFLFLISPRTPKCQRQRTVGKKNIFHEHPTYRECISMSYLKLYLQIMQKNIYYKTKNLLPSKTVRLHVKLFSPICQLLLCPPFLVLAKMQKYLL